MPRPIGRAAVPVVQLGSNGGQAMRNSRRPRHEFYVRYAPWAIQPICIAPVIPGDTMTHCHIEARTVTDPLSSKLLGWWSEIHLFYVKHRDIDAYLGNTSLQDLALKNTPAASGGVGAATVTGGGGPTYRVKGRRDYVTDCLHTIVRRWFRDEDDAVTDFTEAFSGLPLKRFKRQDWTDSLTTGAILSAPTGDFNVDLNAGGTITASEVDQALTTWQWLKANNWTDMTYEDWLGTYGVRQPRTREHWPELLRSEVKWQYPSNTVTQGTGAVTSAVVWSLSFDANKARYFSEPGFLMAVQCTYPKLYRRVQTGALANLMDTSYAWLPAVLWDDPNTSLHTTDSISGAIASVTLNNGVQAFDLRDLFMYGDQFLAATPSVSGGASVAGAGVWNAGAAAELSRFGTVLGINQTSGRADYPLGTLAERNSLFVGTTNETNLVESEGTIAFQINSTVRDLSPGRTQQ